jgi:hypothetical protein
MFNVQSASATIPDKRYAQTRFFLADALFKVFLVVHAHTFKLQPALLSLDGFFA